LAGELDTPPRAAMNTGARCSFCQKLWSEVGPLVEGKGLECSGQVFICANCAELALAIIAHEKQRRSTRGSQEEPPMKTVRKPTLAQLQAHVRKSVDEHHGILPKESALVLFGSFASLLTNELLSIENFETLMKSLPEYPDDPVMQRILGRRSASTGNG
jgi:hypothetical protein